MSLRSFFTHLLKTQWLPAALLPVLLTNCAGPEAYGYGYPSGPAPSLASLPIGISVSGPGGPLMGFGHGRSFGNGYSRPVAYAPYAYRRTNFVSDMFKNPDGSDKYTKEDWARFNKQWNEAAKKNAQKRKAPKTQESENWFQNWVNEGAERDERIEREREEAWREAAYR